MQYFVNTIFDNNPKISKTIDLNNISLFIDNAHGI